MLRDTTRAAHPPRTARDGGEPITDQLSHYGAPIACLVAVLVVLLGAIRLATVPLALALLIAERIATRLDRGLARLPMTTPPRPVRPVAMTVPAPTYPS